MDNIEFPIHFHHVSVETGAKERSNTEEIRYELRRAITIKGTILNKCLNFLSLRLYLYIKKIINVF